ncbi:histidinol-phosphatase HisJ [Bacillus coahuilensis]|uniref:histidinol-phosphatase HisJ n=1 Tax=Bacillus coahuilensis TaxID=408580 RepID=UPI0009EAC206|nr:histidinol-phosphatase HisJ [Bacillus coahuilensis]
MIKKDGHIHTPYCPHGTDDYFLNYIERAIQQQYSHISFTEHAPLPHGFVDPTPTQDSGMDKELIEDYFKVLDQCKKKYQNKITILKGFEVDYIEGFEEETENFLTNYSDHIEDAILSVHFLKVGEEYVCLDYSEDEFNRLISLTGHVDRVYSLYYETLLKSINADLGPNKPNRIGHMTLVQKFQTLFPPSRSFEDEQLHVLRAIRDRGLSLDLNGAGLSKEYCKETYPPYPLAKIAKDMDIPLVFGSDAHHSKGIGQGYETFAPLLTQ